MSPRFAALFEKRGMDVLLGGSAPPLEKGLGRYAQLLVNFARTVRPDMPGEWII